MPKYSDRVTTAERGEAGGDAFGDGDDVGGDAVVLVAEPLAGAAHAGLDLVEDQQSADLVGLLAQALHELLRRHDEAALALDRLDEDAGDVVGEDLGGEHPVETAERVVDRVFAGRGAVRIGVGCVVDATLQRLIVTAVDRLRAGQRHRQVGTAVEGALEGDHRGPAASTVWRA